ncbi:MAG: hypothetical protein AABY15_03210 [Nanoarchaeota archaeon]
MKYSATVNVETNVEKNSTHVDIGFPISQGPLPLDLTAHVLTSGISLIIKSYSASKKEGEVKDYELMKEIVDRLTESFADVDSFSNAGKVYEHINVDNWLMEDGSKKIDVVHTKSKCLRPISYAELNLMMLRLVIDVQEHPENYDGWESGKTHEGVEEHIRQEHLRRNLFVDDNPEDDKFIDGITDKIAQFGDGPLEFETRDIERLCKMAQKNKTT